MKILRSNFQNVKDWYYKNTLPYVVKSLQKRNFEASYFPNINSLNRKLLRKIPKTATIGIPGSVTIRELGIINKLKHRGNKIIQHWEKELKEESSREVRLREGCADYYLTSANAITLDGDVINIDGIGNRVASMIFGPKNVFIIVGYNKIVSSIEEGIKRSKNIAAVMNARRIGAKTPCATTGICVDCNAKRRICRVISIIQYRPWQTNISIMLVKQQLGF
jgi:hypothetical protein